VSEVVISGNVAVTKAPAPIKVDMPPPVAPPEQLPDRGEGADIRLKHVSDPIEAGEDGRGLREEVRRRRGEPDPIYEWKAEAAMPEPGPSESWGKQLRRASASQHEARLSSLAEDLRQVPGATPESARRAAEFMANPPPIKVVPVADNGQPILPLLDGQPIREIDSFQNLNEAKRAMKNYRDLEDRQRQALADELTQRQEQLERQAEQAQAQQAQVAQQPKPAPQPQPQPQAHPLASRVRAVEQQLVAADRQAAHEQAQIRQWAESVYPPEVLQNPQARAELQRNDPNAHAWLQTADNRFGQLQATRQQLRQVDTAQKIQVAEVQQAQAAAWLEQRNAAQDAEFQRMLEAEMPQFAKGKAREELMTAAKRLMRSQPDIVADYHRGGPARSAGVQMQMAKAAAYDVLQQRSGELASKRAPIPPVLRPGVHRPAGANAMDRIEDLQRQLANATGNQSVKIATKLFQARREAGLTSQD
jgi:hypothetical protein